MADLPTLFFDVGGVLLTNAWDTAARKRAATTFGLDYQEFQTRHEMLKTAFETGRLSLDDYLRKAIFHTERPFKQDDFVAFMSHQSQPLGETLEWVRALSKTNRCRLLTLNNESAELHEYRVKTFGLDTNLRGFPDLVLPGPGQTRRGNLPECPGNRRVRRVSRGLHRRSPPERRARAALGLKAFLFEGLDPLREARGVRHRRLNV